MLRSKHRRDDVADRIASSLRSARDAPPGTDLAETSAAPSGASRSWQSLLAWALLLVFLCIPLAILYILLS